MQAELVVGALVLLILLGVAAWHRRSPKLYIDLKGFSRGSVYVFMDRNKPDIVKIGMTRQFCVDRKEQVSYQMSDGDRLDLVQIFAIDNIHFPRTVESVAHQLEHRHRVRWSPGSNRGREWFYARGERGQKRIIANLQRAARIVRREAIQRGRWPAESDRYVKFWRLNPWGVQKGKLFI